MNLWKPPQEVKQAILLGDRKQLKRDIEAAYGVVLPPMRQPSEYRRIRFDLRIKANRP